MNDGSDQLAQAVFYPTPGLVNNASPLADSVSSTYKLSEFLQSNRLHKKDFADMIGVTLSYVYNLIDPQLSFSTRSTTLERIAVVMGTLPEAFIEYQPTEGYTSLDAGILYLQDQQKKLGLTNLQFLKRFPHNKRPALVDMWRGALPLPLNWAELLGMALILNLTKRDIYPFWEARFRQYLADGGLDPVANASLTASIIMGIKINLGF